VDVKSKQDKDVEMGDATKSLSAETAEPATTLTSAAGSLEKLKLLVLLEKNSGELKLMERWAFWRIQARYGAVLCLETRNGKMYVFVDIVAA
jgi:hypothetical protein